MHGSQQPPAPGASGHWKLNPSESGAQVWGGGGGDRGSVQVLSTHSSLVLNFCFRPVSWLM